MSLNRSWASCRPVKRCEDGLQDEQLLLPTSGLVGACNSPRIAGNSTYSRGECPSERGLTGQGRRREADRETCPCTSSDGGSPSRRPGLNPVPLDRFYSPRQAARLGQLTARVAFKVQH